MGMRPARMCSRCHQTAVAGGRFCALHNVAAVRPAHGSRNPLYNQAVWRKWTRMHVLSRDAVCAFIVNGTRCTRLASAIHHIIPADEWTAAGHDFCDQDNLCGLCKEHHDAVRHMPFALDVLALPWRGGK
jgi:5-methylcytosine-specific restriction endonuclease McrA